MNKEYDFNNVTSQYLASQQIFYNTQNNFSYDSKRQGLDYSKLKDLCEGC